MNEESFAVKLVAKFIGDNALKEIRKFKEQADNITQNISLGYQGRKQANEMRGVSKRLGWLTIGRELRDSTESAVGFGTAIETAWKYTKKLALSMFGVTTIWRGIIKSISVYLATNEKLSARLNGTFYAFGSLFAPILEWILDLLGTFVLYVDAFARGLGFAGINMANLGKEAKKTAKQLAPFDEINNLTSGNSSGSNISNPFESLGIGKFADEFYVFGEWCKENIPTLIGLIVGIGTATKISKLHIQDFGKETFGLSLIIGGIVALIGDVIKLINDPSIENIGDVIKDVGIILIGVGITVGTVTGGWVALFGAIVTGVGLIIANWEKFEEFFKVLWANLKKAWKDSIENLKETWGKMWDHLHTKASEMGKKIKDAILSGLTPIELGFKTWFNSTIIDNINRVIRKVNSTFGTSLKELERLTTTVYKKASSIATGGLTGVKGLATGTNYVPNDQLAYIHQGEAVIPKKFNSSEYFNSDETNALLQELIERVGAIELNPYVTVKDVGQASVKYINQQARVKGGSVL